MRAASIVSSHNSSSSTSRVTWALDMKLSFGSRDGGGIGWTGWSGQTSTEEAGDDVAEHEAADVGEEGNATAVALRRRQQADVGLDELIDEPGPEEEPGRHPHRD